VTPVMMAATIETKPVIIMVFCNPVPEKKMARAKAAYINTSDPKNIERAYFFIFKTPGGTKMPYFILSD
jgi:hypothetical protein